MKRFQCSCGQQVFFENARCLNCNRELGFAPDQLQLTALIPQRDGSFDTQWGPRRKCANYQEYGTCNWLTGPEDAPAFCVACQLNHTIPDFDGRQLPDVATRPQALEQLYVPYRSYPQRWE